MKKIKYVLFVLFCLLMPNMVVNAAGVSISSNSSSVTVGSSVYVYINYEGIAGKLTVSCSNPSVLSSSICGTSDWYDGSGSPSYRFSANSVGSSTITISGEVMNTDGSGKDYVVSRSVTVNVKAKPVVILSSNNNLGSLGVDGGELSPGFSQDVLEYNVEMQPETTKVNLTGSVADWSASVSGLGEREVADGANRLEVVVTAQNGASKTYVVNVNVKEYNPIEVDIDGRKYTVVRKKSQLIAPENYTETTVKIGEDEVNGFYSELTGYTLVGLKDEQGNVALYTYKDKTYVLYKEYEFKRVKLYPMEMPAELVPEGYEKTTLTYNDEEIVAYKMSALSRFSLLYGMNVETGETHIYMYEEGENTLQIYNDELVNLLSKELDQMKFIVAILSGGCTLLFLLCIVFGSGNGKESNKNELDSIDDIQVMQLAGSNLSKSEEKRLQKEAEQRKKEEDKKYRKEEKKRIKEDAKKLKAELKRDKKENKKKKKEKEVDIDIRNIKGTE